jgi:hypothetical protein
VSILIAVAAALISFIATAALSAASDIVKDEIRGWIEVLPGITLRMAAMQLDTSQRVSVYSEEWLPELLFITRQTDTRPITRFITGMRFSLSMHRSARLIARRLHRTEHPDAPADTPRSPDAIIFGPSVHELSEALNRLKRPDVPLRGPILLFEGEAKDRTSKIIWPDKPHPLCGYPGRMLLCRVVFGSIFRPIRTSAKTN